MTTKQPKVTVGFKVTETQKAVISDTAKALKLNTAQYLEALVFRNHPTINELCQRKIQISSAAENSLLELLQPLKAKYPNVSELKLIAVSLMVATENEDRILSNKIKKYL